MSCEILHRPVRQDKINQGEIPGVPITASRELRKARKRIRASWKVEVEVIHVAHKTLPNYRRFFSRFSPTSRFYLLLFCWPAQAVADRNIRVRTVYVRVQRVVTNC